jgi:hypothetical protein
VAFKYLPCLLIEVFASFLTAHSLQVPLVLMIVRWDGMLGFAGGVVEEEEEADAQEGAGAVRAAAEKALRRELREDREKERRSRVPHSILKHGAGWIAAL